MDLDVLENIDTILDSRKNRHIIGGVLLSMAALFSGLAITIVTIKEGDACYE